MGFPWQKSPSGFSASSTAEDVTQGIDATGLTAVVTGASSGIGAETARVFALRGVHVIMAIRNLDAGNKVKETILKDIPNAKIDIMELDVSSLESVWKFAAKFESLSLPLNILINNAGIMGTPFALSVDGIEMQFATNHLGHFFLTNLLLDNMKNTARDSNREGKIINVSSLYHRFAFKGIPFDKLSDKSSYCSYTAYGQSKLANILHANELTRRFKEEGVNISANSLHPGGVDTKIVRYQKLLDSVLQRVGKLILKNVAQGASTQCYVALNPQVEGISGKYFSDNNVVKPSSYATNVDLGKKLWAFSLNLTENHLTG